MILQLTKSNKEQYNYLKMPAAIIIVPKAKTVQKKTKKFIKKDKKRDEQKVWLVQIPLWFLTQKFK